MLQVCAECHAVQYPPRDACAQCLSNDLPWQDIAPTGTLLAETTVRTSINLYFRGRTPWRVASVQLDAGSTVMCHVHGDVAQGGKVRLINQLDRTGHGTLMAFPQEDTPNMQDDPQLREMTCDPNLRRILITDARNTNAPVLAKALKDAGATTIFLGEAETWRPNPNRAALTAIEDVHVLPLDVTDTKSVQELAGEIGGKTDILINNARSVRAGGVMARGDTTFAKEEMEINYLGLMRLAQAFGPGMCARTADGTNAAVAWVNILSAYALCNAPDYGCYSASNAAAFSLSQNMRADFRASGLRVVNLFAGPTEDDWHQDVPPPKLTPNAIARSLVQGLQKGVEDIYCGDVAKDIHARFRAGPKIQEREMTGGGA